MFQKLTRIALAACAAGVIASGTARAADNAAPPPAPVVALPAAESVVSPVVTTVVSPDAAGTAPNAAPTPAPQSLDDRIQDLKGEVIRLNRDLLVLEEELLFPANTQVAVFVSLDVGKLFSLDSVQVRLDDKEVSNYLYTPAELLALQRGGMQRLYLGNLRSGSHSIVAFFTGKGPHDRDYKRGATVQFDKGTEPKYIELRIKDSTGKLQPEFDVKVWQ
jgi:hypothetical protein